MPTRHHSPQSRDLRVAPDAAHFSYRREPTAPGLLNGRERDDGHLVKPAEPLADVDLLEELIRIVNHAQERDAADERRLYDPLLRYPRSSFAPTIIGRPTVLELPRRAGPHTKR